MDRLRLPQLLYERTHVRSHTAKQRIHALLRENPNLDLEQIIKAVRCPRSYARLWYKNFFAPGHQPPSS
jgi:hypothetical protein